MDTEKQRSSPDGTVPGQKALPVLTAEDVAALEELCGDVSGYFYKMLDYMDQRVRDGVRRGEFTEEQARADLDLALWYAYACNNIGDYDYYYKAAQWMPASEPAAEAAKSGIWYYRYACALMYCGRLEEARHYAETGVALDPAYPWGWLEVGKLRAHFGDQAGALEAVARGLELVPGDYEFTTLRREILEGRTLEEMEFHWIDPGCDAVLQAGEDESEAEKRQSIAGICCDPENLAAIKEVLSPTEWEADAPYCTFRLPYQGGSLTGRFFLNEAALSKVPLPWVRELVRRLPELDRRGRTFLTAQAGLGTEGLTLEWFAVQPDRTLRLGYIRDQDQQLVLFDPDFTLRKEDQPALAKPEGSAFLAFVLLESPAWDPDRFRQDLRDLYGIPCLTEAEEDEDGGSTLTFEVDGMLAAVSLYPFPVPHGEAEENAAHNYLWQEAAETAARHQGPAAGDCAAPGTGPAGGGHAAGETGLRRLPPEGHTGHLCQRHRIPAGILSECRPAYGGRGSASAGPGVDGPLPPGRRPVRLHRRAAVLRQGRDRGAGCPGRARRPAQLPAGPGQLCAGGGRDLPRRGDHRLHRGAVPAHLPQRRRLARRHDAEDPLSGCAVTALILYANAPAAYAAGAFVSAAAAASAPAGDPAAGRACR